MKCSVQLGIVNISTIWLPGFTLANETVDVADGGLGTKFVPFCCQKEEISLSTSFRFFQCLVLQWTPMKKLLISFFNNDDSDNCRRRRRRLLIRCRSMRMKASGPRKRLFLSWIISIDCLVLPGRRTAHLKSNTVRSSGLARDESQVTTQ